ncbi:MAG: hypothetical protein IPP30_02480 [Flavobacterium sp.]|nr:hypothetical protein [Flavobacterium sp.]
MRTLLTFFVFLPFLSFAQVGVNTTTPNAALDIQSTNNGVLIPRVQLTDALDIATVVNPAGGVLAKSTLVYNIGSSGIAPDNVIDGFYYWNGIRWIPIAGNATGDDDWYENGTTTAPNAISDNMHHLGKVAIGTATPSTNAAFQVELGTSNTDGVLYTGTFNATATVPNLGAGTRMMFFPGKNAFRAGSVTGTEWDNTNVGVNSVAMGRNTIASGDNATAFGRSYSTGINSTSLGLSIATGTNSTAMGTASANGNGSTATGFSTANGENSISGGTLSIAAGDNSFAVGSGSQAIGANTVAMGNYATATADHSVAMGNSTSTGQNSTAMNASIADGELSTSMGIATANGYGSLATGFSTTQGNYAISGGSGSIASGNNSLATGNSTEARGINAVAFGNFSVASGNNSAAIGASLATGQNTVSMNLATANGENTTAVGQSTANGNLSLSSGFSTTNGQYSFSSGFDTTAQSIGETSLGFYNRLYTMSAAGVTTFNANDHLFNLGNGTSPATRHNALTVYKDGRLNINEEYTLPNTDGTASQILQTDGSGNITWQNPTSFGWELDGNTAITSPVSPVTYGTSTIAATENFIGTTDANDFTIGTDNIERMRVKSTTGNVGIGTATPLQPLHVFKNSNVTKSVILGEAFQSSTTVDYQNKGVEGYGSGTAAGGGYGYGIGVLGIGDRVNSYYATGVFGFLGTTSPTAPATNQALLANGNNLGNAAILTNGNVGIGIPLGTNPTNQLHVNSAIAGAVRIVDGTQAAGRVLTSTATGVGSWQPPIPSGFTHYLGELYLGGIIFELYKGSDGLEHGLIVSLTESGMLAWQTTNVLVGANRSEDGVFNTALMTSSPAATYIATLGAGWYLPSIDELYLLNNHRYYANKGLRLGGYTLISSTRVYWSSTENDVASARALNINLGTTLLDSKTEPNHVRGIRAF